MPIYMDVHIVPGVSATGVAEAHRLDLHIQEDHSCKCMTYWVDEVRESVFCLIEAPNKEAVIDMHNQAHGLVPHKIIEVNSGVVESFLGRIYDPSDAEVSPEGLKVFSDPSFRVLLVTRIGDPVLLSYRLGAERAGALLKTHNEIVRRHLAACSGREVENEGAGFIISFSSASKALACALAIQKDISHDVAGELSLRMSISCGEPVGQSNKLFGDCIQLASHLCCIPGVAQVSISSSVKELVAKDHFHSKAPGLTALAPKDEALLEQLYAALENNWQDPDFDIEEYCQAVAMSKSQLYRKTISLTGLSPNQLLKDYRLEKAKELMKRQQYNISQITFESGFTDPSYFTKCFKKKFGLIPMTYMELLH